MQNVVNVVLLALYTGSSFGFCENKRSATIFEPYFRSFGHSCPIARCVKDMGLRDAGAVSELSFRYQELSRGLMAILGCGNVAYYDAWKATAFQQIYRFTPSAQSRVDAMAAKLQSHFYVASSKPSSIMTD